MARVPTQINPQTGPSALVRQNLRAPNIDTSQIDRGIGHLGQAAAQFEQNMLKRQTFDLNKRFMEETLARTEEYQGREKTADLGAPNFAERVHTDYVARDQALIEEFKQQGYDTDALDEFQLRLGSLTGNFYGKAVGFQAQSVGRKAQSDLDSNATSISQYATANPDAYASGKAEYDHSVDLLQGSLDAPTLEVMRQQGHKVILSGALRGLAMTRPRDVVQALAPQLLQEQVAAGGRSSANPWGNVAVQVANRFGLNPLELGAVMSFESGLDPTRQNASGHLGLIQFGKAEQAKYGITKSSTPEQWTEAITQFFTDRGLKPGSDIMDVYSTILTGSPGNYDTADSNGTTVRNAVPRIIKDHLAAADAWIGQLSTPEEPTAEKLATVGVVPPPIQPAVAGNLPLTVQHRAVNADGSISTVRTISIGTDKGETLIPTVIGDKVVSNEEAIAHYQQTGENFGTFKTVAEADQYAEWLHKKHEAELSGRPSATTGIAALDDADGTERMQALAWARAELNRNEANNKAATMVKVENQITALETTGEFAGEPVSDAELVRDLGPVQAEQMRGKIAAAAEQGAFTQAIKTQSPAQVAAGLEQLRPKDTASPTFAKEQAAYEAAQRAVAANRQARDADPASYVFSAYPNIAEKLRSGDAKGGYAAMAQAYEQLGTPLDERFPLPKEQIAQVATNYLNAPPAARLNNLTQWFTELGRGPLLTSFIHQMREATGGKISGGLGRDAFLYATLAQHPEFRNVMLDAMAGSDVIASDPARVPATAVLERAFRAKFPSGIELNGAASADYQNIAMALYVNGGGRTENNTLTNPDLYDLSVRRAFGGRSSDENTGLVERNGGKLILPPAVTKQQFENWITSRTLQDLVNSSAGGKPPLTSFNRQPRMQDIIDDGQFVMKAPGQYAIKFRNQPGYLIDRTGQTFIVKIAPETVR